MDLFYKMDEIHCKTEELCEQTHEKRQSTKQWKDLSMSKCKRFHVKPSVISGEPQYAYEIYIPCEVNPSYAKYATRPADPNRRRGKAKKTSPAVMY